MDLLNFLAKCDSDLLVIFRLLASVVNLIKIFVPVLLILFGTLDLAKAVIAGKEDEMKKAQSTLIKRVIYAAAVFLVVTLVQFVMGFVADSGVSHTNDWKSCWNAANQ